MKKNGRGNAWMGAVLAGLVLTCGEVLAQAQTLAS